MNVYHVINRNKFAKPKIVIENVVSIKFHNFTFTILMKYSSKW